jgi:shikimate kinase
MSSAPTTIILMGLRASGKSTLGQLLATRLSLTFVDLDDVTAAQLGCVDVPEAWARHGHDAFRKAEAEALSDVLAHASSHSPSHAGQIIALGGGTPTAPGAEAILRNAIASRTIQLIYLRATPATLRARLARTDTSSRPSLTGGDVIDEVQRVFDARDPLYQSLATHTINVDAMREREVVEKIVAIAALSA